MLFCRYTFECINNSIAFYLKTYLYLTAIKKDNFSNFFLIIVNENLTVSKNLITFPTSFSEGYTVSWKVLMLVPETE